jgi:PLP dependent protein
MNHSTILLDNYQRVSKSIPDKVCLVAVSKTKPVEAIAALYEIGHRDFGENKVQELCSKANQLPADIRWHLIGHLQTNKVKHVAPFVELIHSVDSEKLLIEINKQGQKNNRVINCLLQIFIATEETKFGLNESEANAIIQNYLAGNYPFVCLQGLMGMASNTDKEEQIRNEFRELNRLYLMYAETVSDFSYLSMGMSHDYPMAIEEGSNLIRVGSLIFGER